MIRIYRKKPSHPEIEHIPLLGVENMHVVRPAVLHKNVLVQPDQPQFIDEFAYLCEFYNQVASWLIN